MDSPKKKHSLQSKLEFDKTRSDHVTSCITRFFGSIKFLCVCLLIFLIWILWNLNFLPLRPFDPYPFPALEMVVSLFAIILSVSVLINQNKEGRLEKIRQQVEFEVNVRAENEITKVLSMLHEIQKKLGINISDNELETMKKGIDLQEIHQVVNETPDKEI